MSEDFLGGESYPKVRFDEVGVTYKMQVIEVGKVQARDFATGNPITWPDGQPKYTYPTTVTIEGEKHTLWVQGNLYSRIREACKTVGIRSLPGTWLTIRREADAEAQKGKNPAHLFKVKAEAGVLAEVEANPFEDDEAPF